RNGPCGESRFLTPARDLPGTLTAYAQGAVVRRCLLDRSEETPQQLLARCGIEFGNGAAGRLDRRFAVERLRDRSEADLRAIDLRSADERLLQPPRASDKSDQQS